MFCCIGIKVKWLAKLLLWLGALASVIGGVVAIVMGAALIGALILVLGLFASWAISWVIYAIGFTADVLERR